MNMGAWSALATEYVRYVGDAVAVVIAETLDEAKAAAEAVDVDYKVLKSVVRGEDAIKDGAPQLHPEAANNMIFDWEIGDESATDAAMKNAANIVEMDISNNRLVPNAMEPRSALAQYDAAEDHYTLHTTSQNPHVAR